MWYSASYVSPGPTAAAGQRRRSIDGTLAGRPEILWRDAGGEKRPRAARRFWNCKVLAGRLLPGINRRFRPALPARGQQLPADDFRHLAGDPLWTITITYGEIAKKCGRPDGAAQHVRAGRGRAVGHNPISIIIPCHRVVGTGGSLTGYAGGLDKKIWLLRHEGAPICPACSGPKRGLLFGRIKRRENIKTAREGNRFSHLGPFYKQMTAKKLGRIHAFAPLPAARE